MLAYWFSNNGVAQHEDGGPFVVREEPYEVEGDIHTRHNGLHASAHPFDSLCYASGTTMDLVDLSGTIVEHGNPVDKLAASHRKHIKRINAEKTIWEFARWCAIEVAHLWDMPPIVRQFLETGDESIREQAYKAALAALAATAAAMDATRSAAWDAARAAAHAASATRSAARSAAWDAEQRNKFQELIDKAFADS